MDGYFYRTSSFLVMASLLRQLKCADGTVHPTCATVCPVATKPVGSTEKEGTKKTNDGTKTKMPTKGVNKKVTREIHYGETGSSTDTKSGSAIASDLTTDATEEP